MDAHIVRALRHLADMLTSRGEDAAAPRDAMEWTELRSGVRRYLTPRTAIVFALHRDLIMCKDKRSLANEMKKVPEFLDSVERRPCVLLVIGEEPAPAVKLGLAEREKALAAHGTALQVWTLAQLQFDPLKHELVPPHEKLSDDAARAAMAAHGVKHRSQLPVISKTDIIARWLGLKHGDVVRVSRYNENSGLCYYYRACA